MSRRTAVATGLVCCALVCTCASHADTPPIIDGGDRLLIAQWDAFDVELNDQVPPACLPHPARLQEVATQGLRAYGFRIDSEMVPAVVRLTTFGHEAPTGCVVVVDTKVMTFERIIVPNSRSITELNGGVGTTLTKRFVAIGASLVAGASAVMQERLEQTVQEHVAALYWQVQRARIYAFTEWPEIERAWYDHRPKVNVSR